MTALEKAARAAFGELERQNAAAGEACWIGDGEALAKAVLLAVRVPPSEVAEAGFAVTGYEENCDVSFTAMIDAILAEGETK